jgi:Domain of unknown function (DUF4440)
MKKLLTILFLFVFAGSYAQNAETKLVNTLKVFHKALIEKNKAFINQHTDSLLSYGHSNGWVETKPDLLKDLESGFIKYQSYKEDSISVASNGIQANVRFVADITAIMNNATNNYHLKVLEVWVMKEQGWVLFARQAVKAQ